MSFRENRDPYRIWVSEILAQQTRITALLPFFERFTLRFPTVYDLASSDEEEVLAIWAGMGYYARARNLRKAAQVIVTKHNGQLPQDIVALQALPGVGTYTAGAIASIAYGQREPAVDGNVRRVYARIAADNEGDPTPWVWRLMEGVNPGDVTEALMELGALVCLPKSPRCEICPVQEDCRAKQANAVGLYPKKLKKPEKSIDIKVIIVDLNENKRILLRKRTESLLNKMYEFPDENTLLSDGFTINRGEEVLQAEHIFTHRIWKMTGVTASVSHPEGLPEGYGRYTLSEMDALAIPSAMKAFVAFIK